VRNKLSFVCRNHRVALPANRRGICYVVSFNTACEHFGIHMVSEMNWMHRLRAWAMQSAFRFILVFGLLVGGYLFLWTMAIWLSLSRWAAVGGMDIFLLAELSVLAGLTLSGAMWALLLWQRRRQLNWPKRGNGLSADVRIYRQSLGWRVAAVAIATVTGCGGLWLMHWSFYLDSKLAAGWALSTVGSLGIAEGAFVAIAMTTSKAIYYPDAVEIRCAIPFPRSTGRMLRSDIAAKKNRSILMPTYLLYPKERSERKLFIWVPKENDYFRNWIAGIPDADRQFFRK
jgi:hypothetical protein